MRYDGTKPVDMGKKVKMAFFWANAARIAVYWAIFYVTMIPFFGFTWKTLSAGFVLAFFAGLINHLRMEMMQARVSNMSDMIGSMPPITVTDKDMESLSAMFKNFGGQ